LVPWKPEHRRPDAEWKSCKHCHLYGVMPPVLCITAVEAGLSVAVGILVSVCANRCATTVRRMTTRAWLSMAVAASVITLLLTGIVGVLKWRDTSHGAEICCTPMGEHCGSKAGVDWTKTVVVRAGPLERIDGPYTIPRCELDNLLSLLDFVAATMSGGDVPWHLAYGTLLGAVREKGHIPFETDIDVLVDAAYWPQAATLIESALGTTHFMFEPCRDCGEPCDHRLLDCIRRIFFGWRNRLHVDFWLYERGTAITQEFQKRIIDIPNEVLFPLTQCTFHGRKMPCPKNGTEYLRNLYGWNWHIPQPKDSLNPTYYDGQGLAPQPQTEP